MPGNGGGAWMEDGTSLTMSFDNICFLQLNSIMKGEVSCANSLAGTLCTYDEYEVL